MDLIGISHLPVSLTGGDHHGHPEAFGQWRPPSLVTTTGALLIQRADNGHSEPPGRVLELGETIEDGLHRNVRGKTGLDIEPGPVTGVYKNMVRHHCPRLPVQDRRQSAHPTKPSAVSVKAGQPQLTDHS